MAIAALQITLVLLELIRPFTLRIDFLKILANAYLLFTACLPTLLQFIQPFQFLPLHPCPPLVHFLREFFSYSWSSHFNGEATRQQFKEESRAHATMIEVSKICLDNDSFNYAALMLQKFR